MNFLIIGDALETLNAKSDTSLYFARTLLSGGDSVVWSKPSELAWQGIQLSASGLSLKKFKRGDIPNSETVNHLSIHDFSTIFIRKDPPFNVDYVRLCWLLMPFEKKIPMLNRPQNLLRYHEKMLPFEVCHQGFISEEDLIPQWIVKSKVDLDRALDEAGGQDFVVKPWLGFGGNKVERMTKSEVSRVSDRFEKEDLILQKFDPEVLTNGDRRVFFWRGKYIGDFVRMPASGSMVSNLAQGGSAVKRDLSKADQKLIWKIEKFLEASKIDFAGADLIGSRLNEINITSPTGLGAYEDLFGKDLSIKMMEDLKLHL